MRIEYPVKMNEADSFMGGANVMGVYPLGIRQCWHGGLHLESIQEIRSISDGHIVAFRLSGDYLTQTLKGKTYLYSNSFVLIQHNYESEKGQKLIFYSLYGNLQPKRTYMDEQKIPDFCSKKKYITNAGKINKKGMEMWLLEGIKKREKDRCILIPQGTRVTVESNIISTKGEFGKNSDYRLASFVLQGQAYTGYISTKETCFHSSDTNELPYADILKPQRILKTEVDKVIVKKKDDEKRHVFWGVEVWADENRTELLDILPEGTELDVLEKKTPKNFIKIKVKVKKFQRKECGTITIDGRGTDVSEKVEYMQYLTEECEEEVCAYVEAGNVKEKSCWDETFPLDEIQGSRIKIPIKAGDTVGYTGLHTGRTKESYYAAHIEIFTENKNGLMDFLNNTLKDGISEDAKVKNPYVKLPQKLLASFEYRVLTGSKVKYFSEKEDYYEMALDSVDIEIADRMSLGAYMAASRTYAWKDDLSSLYGGVLSPGGKFLLLDTDEDVKEKEAKNDKSRRIQYFYPVSGQRFWIEKEKIEKVDVKKEREKERLPIPVFSLLDTENRNSIIKFEKKTPAPELEKEDYYRMRQPVIYLGQQAVRVNLYLNCPENAAECPVEGDVTVCLSDLQKIHDGKEIWYYVNNLACRALDGCRKKYKGYFKADEKEFFPPHQWEKFGFKIAEHDKDKYIMKLTETSGWMGEFWRSADSEKETGHTPMDYDSALHDFPVIFRLSRLICYHRSEWAYDDTAALNRLKTEFKTYLDAAITNESDSNFRKQLETERDEKLASIEQKEKNISFWNSVKIDTTTDSEGFALEPFPKSPYVFHFHPIAFVEQMKRIKKCYCGKEHIDLRASGRWISQFNEVFGTKKQKQVACFKASQYILIHYFGLHEKTSTRDGRQLQVAKEIKSINDFKNQAAYLEIDIKVAKEGILYIDEQLEMSYPVVVGVDHTFDKKIRKEENGKYIYYPVNADDTTDHWIVIIGRGCIHDKAYYLYYEVGTSNEKFGTNDDNKLFVNNDFSLSGIAKLPTTEKFYVVTQIRKNKLP